MPSAKGLNPTPTGFFDIQRRHSELTQEFCPALQCAGELHLLEVHRYRDRRAAHQYAAGLSRPERGRSVGDGDRFPFSDRTRTVGRNSYAAPPTTTPMCACSGSSSSPNGSRQKPASNRASRHGPHCSRVLHVQPFTLTDLRSGSRHYRLSRDGQAHGAFRLHPNEMGDNRLSRLNCSGSARLQSETTADPSAALGMTKGRVALP